MARVLIVEDEPAIAENLAALLRLRGHVVEVVGDGADAVEAARKKPPELILLDVMLPRMSGFEACRMLKADPKSKGSKVIMVTGLGRMADVEDAFSAGADDYLIKPFDSERLFKKMEKVLARP
jgi:two-component system phosphate regulon response regulator PhoB